MIDGDFDSALVVTPETIYKTKKDGSIVKKQVWVALDTPKPTVEQPAAERSAMEYEPVDMSESHPHPETARTYQVSILLYLRVNCASELTSS
jgi:hypothetical protein